MNQTEATHLIRDVFEQPFDEARFTYFVRELLNEIDESKGFRPIAGHYIPASFREHVRQYRRITTYTDPDGEAVDILVVQLKHATARLPAAALYPPAGRGHRAGHPGDQRARRRDAGPAQPRLAAPVRKGYTLRYQTRPWQRTQDRPVPPDGH
jgi:hypothetical protein